MLDQPGGEGMARLVVVNFSAIDDFISLATRRLIRVSKGGNMIPHDVLAAPNKSSELLGSMPSSETI